MKKSYKRIIALVLSVLLLIGTIPVFAADTLPVVVVDPTGETTEGYECYTTMTEAIDALGGKAGKVYVKGALSAAGTALEGTIADREPIIIAGFGDSAANGTITIDTAASTGRKWTKGDITFENITILLSTTTTSGGLTSGSSGRSEYALASGGNTITFGEGVKTGAAASSIWSNGSISGSTKDTRIAVGNYPGNNSDLNVNITSGNFYTVQALLGGGSSNLGTTKMNATINISGKDGSTDADGTFIDYLGTGGTPSTNDKTLPVYTINGDVTFNITGGYVNYFNVMGYGTTAVNVLGDTIANISGGHIQNHIYYFMRSRTAPDKIDGNADWEYPESGNIAILVDVSKGGKAIIGSRYYTSCVAKTPEKYPMAEGKYMIAVYNNAPDDYNYESGNTRFNFGDQYDRDGVNYYTFDRFNYRLVVKGGYAQPVFVRTNPADPSTSYLKGFTIEANEEGYVPVINGEAVKVSESYPEHEGKTVYDLSDYVHTPDDAPKSKAVSEVIDTITFIEDVELNGRAPVVSTDDSFTPDSAYKKFSSLSSAISALGEEGGTVYVKGEYTLTDMAEFAATKNFLDGKKLTILGYTADGSATADNVLNFGNCDLRSAWLYSDIEFNNIKVANTLGSNDNKGFNSNGNTIIFGDNIETDLKTDVVGNVVNGVANNIVINSGTFTGLYSHKGSADIWDKAGTAVNYTINGGSFLPSNPDVKMIYVGFNSYKTYKVDGVTVGDVVSVPYITWNINGGDFNKNKIRTMGYGTDYAKTNVTGAMVLDIAGGTNIGQIEMYPSLHFDSIENNKAVYKATMANLAIILDVSKAKTTVNSYLSQYGVVKTNENNGKKYIVCINNYAGSNVVNNDNNSLDYIINTTGGETKPVFEETTPGDATTSTLKGFTIVPNEENEGKIVTVGGVKVTPDANGIYDLSDIAEDRGQVYITFEEADDTDYSPFIGFANDFNNSYNKLINPDETVNVVYMGGSITHGVGVVDTDWSTCWRERTGAWLKAAFPANVRNISKAASGTGTTFGLHRNINDIISSDPDILFIEFAINDNYDGVSGTVAGQQLETIIREVKFNKPTCDIVVILSTDVNQAPKILEDGTLHSQAEAHEAVAKAYGIPIIYAGKAVCSFIDPALKDDKVALKAAWAEYMIDIVHPNEKGYAIYFNTIRTFLETVYSGSYTANNINVDVTNENTIVTDRLFDGDRTFITTDKTVTVKNSATAPVTDTTKNLSTIQMNGFTVLNEAQKIFGNLNYNGALTLAQGADGSFTVNFKGTELALISSFSEGDKIYYTLDDGTEKAHTVTSNKRWPIKLLTGIESGEHTVTIRVAASDLVTASDIKVYAVSTLDDATSTGNTGYVKKQEITDLDSFKGTGDVPAKNGYLFAGWYESETAEKAMTADEFTAAETAVAKFIPKAVLTIGWQIAKGENGTANLRLISTVDSLQYSGVRFTLKCAGRDDLVLDSKKVYTGIVGYVNGNKQDYVPTDFSSASQYFMTHIVSGIPESYHDVDFTVTAAIITKDGMEVTGDPITFQLKNATDYDSVMNGTNK